MKITLTRRHTGKNGWVSYKVSSKRSAGTVVLGPKMFSGEPPETLEIEGENLSVPQPEPQPAADQPAA